MVDKNNSLEQSNNKSAGFIDDTTQAEYWNMNVMAPAGGLKCTAKEMGIYLSNMSKPLGTHNSSIVDSLTSPCRFTYFAHPFIVGNGRSGKRLAF